MKTKQKLLTKSTVNSIVSVKLSLTTSILWKSAVIAQLNNALYYECCDVINIFLISFFFILIANLSDLERKIKKKVG